MRLLFVCSSLEAGRDGVGDYTRALARACQEKGHACALLALHDARTETIRQEDGPLPLLRLPAALPWAERTAQAVEWARAFAPQWVSLQFVPYGWQRKGIVWGEAAFLKRLTELAPLQMMMHELWIGAHTRAGGKERLTGWVQKAAIRRLLGLLAPRVLHTSNAVYAEMLERLGRRAAELPLFGNIPVVAHPSTEWLYAALQKAGVPLTAENRSRWEAGVIFGTLYADWPPEPLFTHLRRRSREGGKKVLLLSIGRLGAAGQALWEELAARTGEEITLAQLGEGTPDEISGVLQWADFGVAGAPRELLGKSGTAAAMREHGLPVVANRDDWHLRGKRGREEPEPAWLLRPENLAAQRLPPRPPPAGPGHGPAETAERFLQALEAAQAGGSENALS